MHRNQSVNTHQFAMVPRADVPRSGFKIQTSHKTSFDAGWLIPIYCTEVLPGDTFNLRSTIFARLATPVVPVMDNLYLDTFYFFVPNRLVWTNWVKMMGEQDNPGDSIDYQTPQVVSAAGGFAALSIYDYFGLPTVGQVAAGGTVQVCSMPLRAYNLIWNEWFRDENLQNKVTVNKGDTGDLVGTFALKKRGKRHDYFTSCLPWVQKGDSVALPLGGQAPVFGDGKALGLRFGSTNMGLRGFATGINADSNAYNVNIGTSVTTGTQPNSQLAMGVVQSPGVSGLYADLSQATAATINQLRQAFQIQKLLERDARGGTRYTELVRSHFGVISPDARLQRPEYLGGGSTPVNISPVPQTSGSPGQAGTYTETPQGNLAAVGQVVSHGNGFTQSFTEHGFVIGLCAVRADLNYQQGLRKMWSRQTRYDFYWPVFSHLGEQAVLNKEIYCKGDANDELVFGYQERWAEYRYQPSQITGLFRSTHPQPLDVWHLAQEFSTLPTLNATFIEESPPIDRIVATTDATGQQFIADMFFNIKAARPLPMYSVPGLVDHF
ncbi:major capsid protein [Chifec microvirus UA13_14]|nr:major capsid protein [Chifec microvirus UA13_14]